MLVSDISHANYNVSVDHVYSKFVFMLSPHITFMISTILKLPKTCAIKHHAPHSNTNSLLFGG